MPISLSLLGPGPNPPKIIDVLIEIPKDSRIKYEADFESGLLRVDRVLSVAALYPCNYGFIPGTLEVKSQDPIDVYVLGDTLVPFSLISCYPIGVILTEDQDGNDSKIIAVPQTKVSPEFSKIKDVIDLPVFFRDKLEHFIRHHKDLEAGKFVNQIRWEDKGVAELTILQGINRSQQQTSHR
jgi:inorganic pyrophosphatase